MSETKLHTHTQQGKLYLYILIFVFLNMSRKTEYYQNLICDYIL